MRRPGRAAARRRNLREGGVLRSAGNLLQGLLALAESGLDGVNAAAFLFIKTLLTGGVRSSPDPPALNRDEAGSLPSALSLSSRRSYRGSHIVRPASNGVVQSGGRRGRPLLFLPETYPLRAKTVEDREILELIDPVADSIGLSIVRVRLMGGTLRRRLQVMAERPADNDIDVGECARLSRAMSEVLDAADPIAGEYLLEVSSPGIDRPLTRLKDFDLFEGLEARLETDRMIEGRKRFKGLVAGTDGDNIAIDLDGEDETALIPFDWLVDAKLVMNDALLKRGAAIRAARGEPEDDGLPQGAPEDPHNAKTSEDDA